MSRAVRVSASQRSYRTELHPRCVASSWKTSGPFSAQATSRARRCRQPVGEHPAVGKRVDEGPGVLVAPELLDFDLRRIFTDPIPDQHCSLQALLAEAGDEPVVVLHDTTFLGSWPVLLGAPGSQPTAVIGLGITVVPISSMDTAPFALGLPPDSSEEGRARYREARPAQRELWPGGGTLPKT